MREIREQDWRTRAAHLNCTEQPDAASRYEQKHITRKPGFFL
jgi:hypothetical protein